MRVRCQEAGGIALPLAGTLNTRQRDMPLVIRRAVGAIRNRTQHSQPLGRDWDAILAK